LFSIITFLGFSQNMHGWISQKFKNADTILLVSHDDTQGYAFVDSAGNRLPNPKLFLGNKPNYTIIKERRIISGRDLDSLIQILAGHFIDSIVTGSGCYMPHHTIFIFRDGELSYIDLCFWCRSFTTSKDLDEMHAFDKRTWDELENYFRKFGFKYKLDSFEQ
jgi:hypothetical protein